MTQMPSLFEEFAPKCPDRRKPSLFPVLSLSLSSLHLQSPSASAASPSRRLRVSCHWLSPSSRSRSLSSLTLSLSPLKPQGHVARGCRQRHRQPWATLVLGSLKVGNTGAGPDDEVVVMRGGAAAAVVGGVGTWDSSAFVIVRASGAPCRATRTGHEINFR